MIKRLKNLFYTIFPGQLLCDALTHSATKKLPVMVMTMGWYEAKDGGTSIMTAAVVMNKRVPGCLADMAYKRFDDLILQNEEFLVPNVIETFKETHKNGCPEKLCPDES